METTKNMTKQNQQQNQYLVRRVSLTDSIKNIPAGIAVTFDCREAGPMASAKSAVCRLNKSAGMEKYKITSQDNGVTYTITHNK